MRTKGTAIISGENVEDLRESNGLGGSKPLENALDFVACVGRGLVFSACGDGVTAPSNRTELDADHQGTQLRLGLTETECEACVFLVSAAPQPSHPRSRRGAAAHANRPSC